MRVTNRMMIDDVIRYSQGHAQRLSELNRQLATSKRINRPSDDPTGAARALSIRQTLDQNEQYSKNLSHAKSWLTIADSTLQDMSDSLGRARELTVQASNDPLSADDRRTISDELGSLLDHVVALGNTQYGDDFIFSGQATSTEPFKLVGSVVQYLGDPLRSPSVAIAPNEDISLTPPGNALISVFETIARIRDDLSSASTTGPLDNRLTELDQAENTVLSNLSRIGAKGNRVESYIDRIDSAKVVLTEHLSMTEDADLLQVITDLSAQESVYKASLAAAGRVIQPSLMDYLS